MAANTTYCFTIMFISMAFIVLSYISICLKERKWINWYTFPAFLLIVSNYLLPSISLWINGPSGSYFAYTYCYLTYACASISVMLGYRIAKSNRSSTPDTTFGKHNYKYFPWILLTASVLLYLPIILEFREFLLAPREIYMRTRTGYGLNFFGSAVMMYLAFITYLFKKRKSLIGGFLLFTVCVAIIYLHGSKGEVLGLVEVFILYRVYILGHSVNIGSAVASVTAIALVGSIAFALFGGISDIGELALSMSAYSDYTHNAILVIDDPKGQFYWGKLTVEDEVYSRVPRLIMPNKPKDYGSFKLASIYYPAWFQGDTGSPAFGIGVQYADFGVFAIAVISLWSILYGWMVSLLVASLKSRPEPGRFVVLLFFAGVGIIPLGDGYLLPETIALGMTLTFVYRHKLVLIQKPQALRPV